LCHLRACKRDERTSKIFDVLMSKRRKGKGEEAKYRQLGKLLLSDGLDKKRKKEEGVVVGTMCLRSFLAQVFRPCMSTSCT